MNKYQMIKRVKEQLFPTPICESAIMNSIEYMVKTDKDFSLNGFFLYPNNVEIIDNNLVKLPFWETPIDLKEPLNEVKCFNITISSYNDKEIINFNIYYNNNTKSFKPNVVESDELLNIIKNIIQEILQSVKLIKSSTNAYETLNQIASKNHVRTEQHQSDIELKYKQLTEHCSNLQQKLDAYEKNNKYFLYDEDMTYIKYLLKLQRDNFVKQLNAINEKTEKEPNDFASIKNLEDCIYYAERIYNKYFKY